MSVDKIAKSMETVELTKEAYDELVADQEFLNCLRACGVDNWEGYDLAAEMFQETVLNED